MNWFDYIIVVVYAVGFLMLGKIFSKKSSRQDYYLGGKSFGWFPLSLSVMATQLSAISFISAPAFVGIREGGGMQWLSYEFGVPLAMIFLGIYLVPKLYKSGIVSIYEYLEKRFGRSTRVLISIVFQVSRAFGTGVMIYAVALILMSVLGIPFYQTILIIGVITVIYSYQGGMSAVVYGDMIQMIILLGGIVIIVVAGLGYLGGVDNFLDQVDHSRLTAVNFKDFGIGKGNEFGFFPMLIGGFFLYTSYYGTDQSQVQRLLSAKNVSTARNTLLVNGLFRFPITLLYSVMGLIIGTYALSTPEFLNLIPSDKPDLMIPIFIRDYLPHGLVGLLIVAILSAAMSSLSSTINSLSAVTTEDILVAGRKVDDKTYIRYSKLTSVFWGVVTILLAFVTGDIAQTVIEAINKVGSVFYGPILATFIIATMVRWVHARAMNIGLIVGVLTNVYLWLVVGDYLFWFWWNFIGAAVTYTVAVVTQSIIQKEKIRDVEDGIEDSPYRFWTKNTILLLIQFAVIILVSLYIKYLF
jgi:SSS family transporter